MARTTTQPVQTTGNTPFTGEEYKSYLEVRRQAMQGFADETVDQATKNAARALVRNARKAIQNTGMTVVEWREAEEVREAEALVQAEQAKEAKKAARLAKKAEQQVAVAA